MIKSKLLSIKGDLFSTRIVFSLVRSDLRNRYQESLFGLFWLFLTPLIQLALYTAVFSTIFQTRWQFLGTDTYANYAMVLLPGLLIYQAFMEVMIKGATHIVHIQNLKKSMKLSTMDIVLSSLLTSIIPNLVSLIVWMLVAYIWFSPTFVGIIFFLLSTLLLVLFLLAAFLFSSVIGFLIKDWQQIVSIVGLGFLFLSPILYPIEVLPELFQKIINWNPITHFINITREAIFVVVGVDDIIYAAEILIVTSVFLTIGLWLQSRLLDYLDE